MLRYLFIDMNSYFASVEQQDRPELRGRPVAVVPVVSDSTVCIAASYEAKAYGVKTGTRVGEAKRLCPGLVLVEGRHHRYVEVHQQIKHTVESCLHVDRVMSIDEMACRLLQGERTPTAAAALAGRVKNALRLSVGEYLRCSIGIGPNVTLAKVAADLQKPDGLTLITAADLPRRLWGLELQDFPGIGPAMHRRLRRSGITRVCQLTALSAKELAHLWQSKVLGERWWLTLRGEDTTLPAGIRRSMGHSHVLPPRFRNELGACTVLQRLLHKAARRMRSQSMATRVLTVQVRMGNGHSWKAAMRTQPLADTPNLLEILLRLWRQRPSGQPQKVGVTLGDLAEVKNLTQSLFAPERKRLALSLAMDRVNEKFGARAAYFGGVHGALEVAPPRIAFNRIPEISSWTVDNSRLAAHQ